MSMKILRVGTREAVRHPQGALRASAAALKHRRALMAAVIAARQAARYGALAKQTTANPRVRAEARMAMLSLALAARQAQETGIADAVSDKRVMDQLRQAGRHSAKAVKIAKHARRRARVVRTTAFLAGAALVGCVAYGGRKMYAQPQQPSNLSPDDTADSGSPTAGGATAP